MEKKIKRTQKGAKSASYSSEEKTIILTILVALVILSALLVNLALDHTSEEKFVSIYYLDSEKQTENIPKTVVLGENSTFSLWVGVENQNGTTKLFSVRVKVDDGTGPVGSNKTEATQSVNKTLLDEEIWEFPITISIDQLGHNRVLFELWFLDETKDDFDYTGKWVYLSLEAIQA